MQVNLFPARLGDTDKIAVTVSVAGGFLSQCERRFRCMVPALVIRQAG